MNPSSRNLSALAVAALVGCAPAPHATVVATTAPHGGTGSKTYQCKQHKGCVVQVGGRPTTVVYGGYAPVVCGVGVVVVGCGCGYYVPASCSCGETFVPVPACAVASCAACAPPSCAPSPPPACSAPPPPSCAPPPSCSASCGSSCGSG